MAEKRCVYKCGAWNCGSYQFNLYKDDIDQGELCDVHYWQTKAQRPWQGLTDEEIESAISDGFARGLDDGNVSNRAVIKYVRGIEAKLKERNT